MKNICRVFLLTISCFFVGSLAYAEIKLPAIASDKMILQQQMEAPIWGWADPEEKVSVSGSWGESASGIADDGGKWKIFLKTPSFGGPYTLSIQGKNKITIKNVMIGEVWLCAGQSNMGFRLGQTFDGKQDSASAKYPKIRIFHPKMSHNPEPQDDCVAEWTPCFPKTARTCSAVSFYFARKLHQELGVPVGIIVQAYGGTPIEAWIPKDLQMHDPRTQRIVEEADAKSASFDWGLAKRRLVKASKLWEQGKRKKKPELRTPSNWGNQYPGNVFNSMIHPVRPYGIRGAIWYQGEGNAKGVDQAANYVNQLPLLINYYRSSWHDLSEGNVAKDFPFFFVQLPSWLPPQTEPVEAEAPWAAIREMMRLTAQTVPNTGVAVTIDTGDPYNIHPKDKKPVGLRLAYLALKKTYGKDFVEYGPYFKSYRIEGDTIVLAFDSDSLGSGLMKGKEGPLNSFAIAGKDRKFVEADAILRGDSVVVSAKGVSNPTTVRYAWAMNPSQRNLLYNKEGLPASPFRTDDWPLFDPDTYHPKERLWSKRPKDYRSLPMKRPPMTQ